MKPDRIGDFLVRFLSVSKMLDDATKPRLSSRQAPPPAGALDEARRHMFELRGEARQLIMVLNEEAIAAAREPETPHEKGKAEAAHRRLTKGACA